MRVSARANADRLRIGGGHFSDARNAWPIQRPLVEMTPRGYSNDRLVSRFRSSRDLAAHSCANFGIRGTLANL